MAKLVGRKRTGELGFLRQLLRGAVLDALAVSCIVPLAGCSSSTDGGAPAEADAATAMDSAMQSPDSGADTAVFDAAVTPDSAHPPDTAPDTYTQAEAATSDGSDDGGSCAPVAPNECGTVSVRCLTPGLVVGYNQAPPCDPACGNPNPGCEVSAGDGGSFEITCLCGGGRFPAGLAVSEPAKGDDPVGIFLARSAALEAAAVVAFKRLAGELVAHGAPPRLVAQARRAARQEGVHARLLRKAASSRGASEYRMRMDRQPAGRSLLELARENAVEGCGREMLGAALLGLQSERANDETLRPIFRRIAADELEHAALAWDVQDWLESRLGADERALVESEHRDFLARCGDDDERVALPVASAVGWPSPAEWRVLAASVRRVSASLASRQSRGQRSHATARATQPTWALAVA